MVGTFCAVTDNLFCATVMGIMCMGIAGELACSEKGLGRFHQAIIDHISLMDGRTMLERGKLNVR